jgi:hypothetical protein
MRPPLYRLPDGTHVELATITAIQPFDADDNSDPRYSLAPRVVVISERTYSTLLFDSDAQAKEFADTLAALVNKAREGE